MSAALLGFDFGEKRIGVAVAPQGTGMAFPLGMIPRKNREQILAEIQQLVTKHQAEKIIVGLPIQMNGALGPAAQKLTKEIEWFRVQLAVPIILWDERLSTKEAERILLEADVNRAKRKEVIDQLAAQCILQNYLDYSKNQPLQK